MIASISDRDRLAQVRESHLDLSNEDWRFRELAMERPELLLRASFEVLDAPSDLLKYRLQSWPTLIARSRMDELGRVSVEVSRLVRGVLQKVFGNDAERISNFFGAGDPTVVELLLEKPDGIDDALSRGDFIRSADGWKCIEFNMVPTLGGWDGAFLTELHLGIAASRRAIDDIGCRISSMNTVGELSRHLRAAARRRGVTGSEINVAIVTPSNNPNIKNVEFLHDYLRREYRAVLSAEGATASGDVFICYWPEIVLEPGNRLSYQGRRIDAVVELHKGLTDPRVFRSAKSGEINLYNGPVSRLLSDKRNLALLSDDDSGGDYSAEERRTIEAYIPWTRLVRMESTRFRGERVYLPRFLEKRREDLVLKSAVQFGGKDVYIGAFTAPEEWAAVIKKALVDGRWVVQERVLSRPYLYQNGEAGCSPHDMIWGPFVFGDRPAGCVLRMQPTADLGVVNLSLTATQGIVFEVPDPLLPMGNEPSEEEASR